MKKGLKSTGITVLIIGAFLILNSALTITGNVVSTPNSSMSGDSLFGFIFIVGGLVIFMARDQGLEGKLEIIKTEAFEKAIKKHNLKPIQRAIEKIGTGLGKEEHLKYLKGKSIRTSRDGRILYERVGNVVTLNNYLPPSKHY